MIISILTVNNHPLIHKRSINDESPEGAVPVEDQG